jgi:hydrogenase expression/formation protein HypC
MCIGLAGRILSIEGDDLDRVAIVDVGTGTRRVGLVTLPDAAVDDVVLIHAGYAVGFAAD